MHIENIGVNMIKVSLAFSIRSNSRSHGLVNSIRQTPRIYRNEGTRISNHTTRTKQRSTKPTQKILATKQKALKCKGVDVLESDRWNVNSKESTDKEFLIQDYD